MKRVLFAVLWLAGFTACGMVLLPLLSALAFHTRPSFNAQLLRLGGEMGADAGLFLLCFARLPGARRPRAAPAGFGLWQAAQGLLGFGAMLLAGGLLIYNVLFLEDIGLAAAHAMARVVFTAPAVAVFAFLGGEIAAALWLTWFLRHLGRARVSDGSAAGIAWRPASPRAYLVAALLALLISVAVLILYHFIPPNMKALQKLPDAQLFDAPGWMLGPVLLLFIVVAPVLEEVAFRGIAFAGIAARLGPVWAAVLTTLLFMLVHAPEKMLYPPGFVDVGLLAAGAAWLRLRYGSIRPGILLHILYNGGLMAATSLAT